MINNSMTVLVIPQTVLDLPYEAYLSRNLRSWVDKWGGKIIDLDPIGWCPRGEGHADMPEPDEDSYGVCGSKWEYKAWMTPWEKLGEDDG